MPYVAITAGYGLYVSDNKVYGANLGPPRADRTQMDPMLVAHEFILSGVVVFLYQVNHIANL